MTMKKLIKKFQKIRLLSKFNILKNFKIKFFCLIKMEICMRFTFKIVQFINLFKIFKMTPLKSLLKMKKN